MNATLLKRLFRAIQTGSRSDMEVLCQRIVDGEAKRGHGRVAEDLAKILRHAKSEPNDQAKHGHLSRLPTSRRDLSPLVQDIAIDQLRHEMVLPEGVENRLQRIEKEFAARSRLAKHGLKPRRRILLYGPPGCGKSLGAERLAWNTGLPLRKVRFDTLLSSYFGETMSNLRTVFDAALISPCALFLDECDTLARSRTERNDVGEVTRITNGLLEMLEGFKGDGLIIAATNLDSALDPALFRRFDEVLKITLPGIEEILRLLKVTLSAVDIEPRMPWDELSREMDGMSCSEVVQITQNGAKRCFLEGRKKVDEGDLRHALKEINERHNEAH